MPSPVSRSRAALPSLLSSIRSMPMRIICASSGAMRASFSTMFGFSAIPLPRTIAWPRESPARGVFPTASTWKIAGTPLGPSTAKPTPAT